MAPTGLVVLPVESEDDLKHLQQVQNDAYGSSRAMDLVFGAPKDAAQGEERERRQFEKSMAAWKDDPATVYTKAVTAEGEIVGAGIWYFWDDPSIVQNALSGIECPLGGNQAMFDHVFGTMQDSRKQRYGPNDTHAFLASLAVAPKWQKQGVGKALLEYGLKRADEQGLEVWLDASPYGVGLYKQYDWKELRNLDFDLQPWGGDAGETHRIVSMVRMPKSKAI